MNLFWVVLTITTLAITHISYCTVSSKTFCDEKEEQSLLGFKSGLVDPSNRLASWVGGENCCNWVGVVCHNLTGHVLELHLGGNVTDPRSTKDVDYHYNYHYDDQVAAYKRSSLGGNINNSLLNLRHLRYLDLSNNDFGGSQIPGFFGSMQSLRLLNLSSSKFGGMVPPQLGNLSNLFYLNIGFQGYELYVENLDWLSGFSILKHLDMSEIYLGRASDWFQQINALPSLKELHLGNCNLRDAYQLPNKKFSRLEILDLSLNPYISSYSFLEMFHSLVSLDISGNGISGPLPVVVRNLTSLRDLDLSWNYLNSLLPHWICNLGQLEKLMLGYNIFQGTLSDGIGNLSSLIYLDLSYNQLHGPIPASVGQLFRLEYLNLGHNFLQGTIYEAFFSNLSRLEVLAVSRNEITWRASPDWVPPFQLIRLELSSLQLGPEFPGWLQSQNRLSYLELASTGINDRVPIWFWDRSSQFLYINLTNNNLYGNISEVILSVRFLDLSYNKFEGLLASVSSKVIALDFSNNLFSGPISQLLCHNKDEQNKLQVMILGNNQLSGEIPNCWTGWQELLWVDFRKNFITGNIPRSIGSLCKLKRLLLSNNSLSGIVPPFLQNASSMEILDLSHNLLIGPVLQNMCSYGFYPGMQLLMLGNNRLSGDIPDCWRSLPNLRRLELQENELTGHLPDSIGSLVSLEWIHLQKNNLSGELPSSLQNCTSLKILDIGDNQFGGRLPKWIGQSIVDIRIMRLRSNNFAGIIPNELCGLQSLQTLDIANNNLSGYIPKCIFNLSVMANESGTVVLDPYSMPDYGLIIGPFLSLFNLRKDSADLVSKGSSREYTSVLEYTVFLDLSNNSLSGQIPVKITYLAALISLNLSSNMLSGRIPKNMGNMSSLESLDLSFNQISGEIPQSMATMTKLSFLNLSYNNLTGIIPTSTQFSTFGPSSFLGNNLSVSNNNSRRNGSILANHDHKGVEFNELYVSAVVGFVVGFGIIVVPLLYIRCWRLVYFRVIGRILDRLWELVVLPIRIRFRRQI